MKLKPTIAAFAAALGIASMAGATASAAPASVDADRETVSTADSNAADAKGCARQFRATLAQHLGAIGNRDLQALRPTVDSSVVLIFPSGSIRRGKAEFMQFHKDWFADPNWIQPYKLTDVNIQGCKTAWALVDYTFITLDDDGNEVSRSHNMFSLTWTRKGGQWLVISDQNTKLPA